MKVQLTVDLHAVGPRGGASRATPLPLAVNMSATLEDAPPVGDEVAWMTSLLPWRLFPDFGTAKTFKLVFLDALNPPLDVPAEVPAQDEKIGPTLRRLMEDAIPGWKDRIEFGKSDPAEPKGDRDDDGGKKPWHGLMTLTSALPATLSTALGARWYFQPTPALVAAMGDNPQRKFVVLPASFRTKIGEVDVDLKHFTVDNSAIVFKCYQHGTDLPADTEVHCAAMTLSQVTAPAPVSAGDVDILSDYWLRISDSRHDTLTDFDNVISDHAIPAVLYGVLDGDKIARAIQWTSASGPTPLLPDEVRAVQARIADRLSKLTAANVKQTEEQFMEAVLRDELDRPSLIAKTVTAVTAWWAGELPDLLMAPTGKTLTTTAAFDGYVAAFVEGFLPANPPDTGKPVLPGEGIDFKVETNNRLLRLDMGDEARRDAIDLLAEHGILVRRAQSDTALAQAAWRFVSAALPVVDRQGILATKPWNGAATPLPNPDESIGQHIVPRGMPLAFFDDVLRNDDTYFGALMLGPNALSFTHDYEAKPREGMPDDDPPPDLSSLVFVSPGPAGTAGAEYVWAPGLRYGDSYQLRAAAIDRAGGLPAEISVTGRPWELDLAKLATLDDGGARPIQFLRRVPLGGLNLLPAQDGWPALRNGVALQAVEWYHSVIQPSRPAATRPPVLLFNPPGTQRQFPGLMREYSFNLEPPRLDEHTLMRWEMPPAGAPYLASQNLRDELAQIAERRAAAAGRRKGDPDPVDLLPHDPSVSGLLIELFDVSSTGAQIPVSATPYIFQSAGRYRVLPLKVTCSRDRSAVLPLPEAGRFRLARLSTLVTEKDFARFDAKALGYTGFNHYEDAVGNRYVVIPDEDILLEAATYDMPAAGDLYQAFGVTAEAGGDISVTFNALPTLAHLSVIDRFEIASERWVWRNLPYVPSPADPNDTSARRLTSGLPWGVLKPGTAGIDTAQDVLDFETVKAMDHGLASRPVVSGRWPRTDTGLTAWSCRVSSDDRDGVAAADYLRYGLNVVSRYAALDEGALTVSARSASGEPWRRVATDFRGRPDLRAPKVLAVLPLTSRPRLNPETGEKDEGSPLGTPFLVILEEIWFREYGAGESLRAEIALEDREIGEDDGATPPGEPVKKPRLPRLGPMPHKHVQGQVPLESYSDEEADSATELFLTCYGPYGYSLDRSGDEAVANASAFVVYFPDSLKVAPEWSVAVRFRRLLLGMKTGAARPIPILGPPSGTHLLYTLSDTRDLADDGGQATLTLKQDGSGVLAGLTGAHLRPFSGADPSVTQQMSYVLIAGPVARDGGMGVDIYLPNRAYLLGAGSAGQIPLTAFGNDRVPPEGQRFQGQILELELGAPGIRLLDRANSLTDLLCQMLDDRAGALDRDALARIIRVSAVFDLDFVFA